MIKPYTSEEIRSELKRLGLTQQWLADQSGVSRQWVSGILNNHKLITTTKEKKEHWFRFWTYLLKDYSTDFTMKCIASKGPFVDKLTPLNVIG